MRSQEQVENLFRYLETVSVSEESGLDQTTRQLMMDIGEVLAWVLELKQLPPKFEGAVFELVNRYQPNSR